VGCIGRWTVHPLADGLLPPLLSGYPVAAASPSRIFGHGVKSVFTFVMSKILDSTEVGMSYEERGRLGLSALQRRLLHRLPCDRRAPASSTRRPSRCSYLLPLLATTLASVFIANGGPERPGGGQTQ